MAYNPKDYYFKKAKKENFAARSVFKLEEIQDRLKILKPNQQVLDLGAAPGSWSQLASKIIGPQGKLLGVDLSEISVKLPNATFIRADLRDLNLQEVFATHGFTEKFDIVMSDMAPRTTGIRITDQARSFELCDLALSITDQHLKKNGHFVCKLFHSDSFEDLKKGILQRFEKFEAIKPDSTRKISKEIFLIGLRKKTEQ